MQRKVDAMNGKTGSSPVKNDEGAGSSKTLSNASNSSKDLPFTKNALILAFFVVTVLVGYLLPDRPSKITYLGLTVIAVFHIYVIVVAFLEKKIGETTIFLAKAWFILLVVGWFFPGPIWQAWEDVKGWRNEHKDQPYFFNKASAVADSSDAYPKAKGRWMKFDSDVYTLANPNDPESIIVDNPEEWTPLPKIPTGYRFNVYCDETALKIYWKGGPQYGKELKCGDNFGENLENLLITVSPNTEEPAVVSVWLEPLH